MHEMNSSLYPNSYSCMHEDHIRAVLTMFFGPYFPSLIFMGLIVWNMEMLELRKETPSSMDFDSTTIDLFLEVPLAMKRKREVFRLRLRIV